MMKLLCMCGIVMFLAVGVRSAEEFPDWATHDYAASADEVYKAAFMVIVLWDAVGRENDALQSFGRENIQGET